MSITVLPASNITAFSSIVSPLNGASLTFLLYRFISFDRTTVKVHLHSPLVASKMFAFAESGLDRGLQQGRTQWMNACTTCQAARVVPQTVIAVPAAPFCVDEVGAFH